MATSARLDVGDLDVVPGTVAQCRVLITNHGSIVEGYALRVVGALAAYAQVAPPTLSLYPDTEGEATVTIALPRGAPVEAGDVPFAVVVEPHEHPGDVAVPEATAHVEGYDELTVEMTPHTAHGRRTARYSLAVDNRGNRPVTLVLTGWDPDDALDFAIKPRELTVRPAQAAFAHVGVSAVERIWRGAPQTHAFRLDAALAQIAPDAGPSRPVAGVDGLMVQDATLPPWLGRALLAAAAALVALTVLWFAALRPVIRTTAQDAAEDAVAEQIGQLQEDVVAARQEAAQAQTAAGAAQQAAGSAATSAQAQQAETQRQEVLSAQAQALAGAPVSRRLAVTAPAGGTDEASFEVPTGQVLRVTDLVFESPGDVGLLQVLRDTQVLLSLRPENFRDLDQHFVSPIILNQGEKLRVTATCTTPAAGAAACQEAVYVGGSLAAVPTPTPTPTGP